MNYRRAHAFTENEQRKLRVFADLASLTMYKGYEERQRINSERQKLAFFLHEHPKQQACAVADLIYSILSAQELAPVYESYPIHYQRLKAAYEAAEALKKNVINLQENWSLRISNDLRNAIEDSISLARLRYQFEILQSFEGFDSCPTLPSQMVLQLRLVVEQALSNVHKHASATKVAIRVSYTGDKIFITMEDDGCGFYPDHIDEQHHIGIRIMRERAHDLGGRLDVDSAPGNGARVAIMVPISGGVRRIIRDRETSVT